MKICSKCKENKDLSCFHKDKAKRDGLSTACKPCKIKTTLDHKKRNIEHFREYKKRYREENRDHVNALKRAERTRNRDRYLANYQKNKEYIHEYYRVYRKIHKEKYPVAAYGNKIRTLISSTFKIAKRDGNKNLKCEPILGCSLSFFTGYIQSKFTEGMTWDNYGEWHLDHIMPMATAKTNEDVIRLNHFSNFQPLWALDNFRKSSRILEVPV